MSAPLFRASPTRWPATGMHRLVACLFALGLALPQHAAAAAPGVRERAPASADAAGIVITGDQEAPLVLYVLPWEETVVSQPPPAPTSDLMPAVIDHDRTLLQDYDARQLKEGR